jgi:glycosyltransferase involved in cell wall biosynthesis
MMVDELREFYGVPAEKLHLLYPPLNVNRFHLGWRVQRERLREELGMEAGKKHFLFVSTGHGRKGLPLLLEVFERLSPATHHLWVLGSGKPTRQPNLPHVHFVGFSQEAEKWYAAADAMVHPAVYEPFGQVVSESIACGTPVLISAATGAKELIGPAEGQVLPLEVPVWEQALANFQASAFSPAPDFVQRHRLSVDAHVDRILEICLPQNV